MQIMSSVLRLDSPVLQWIFRKIGLWTISPRICSLQLIPIRPRSLRRHYSGFYSDILSSKSTADLRAFPQREEKSPHRRKVAHRKWWKDIFYSVPSQPNPAAFPPSELRGVIVLWDHTLLLTKNQDRFFLSKTSLLFSTFIASVSPQF